MFSINYKVPMRSLESSSIDNRANQTLENFYYFKFQQLVITMEPDSQFKAADFHGCIFFHEDTSGACSSVVVS